MGREMKSLQDRFNAYCVRDAGCLKWFGPTTGNGRGVLSIGPHGSAKTIQATHIAWFLKHGVWPVLSLLHSCDVQICVDVDHLREGTQAANIRDRKKRGRSCKGENFIWTKYSDVQVQEIRGLGGSMTQTEIAKKLGIPRTTIGHILRGETRT